MSACFAFGEKAGQQMVDIARQHNPDSIWTYNPVYAVLLIGGFVVNMVICLYMSKKNKKFFQIIVSPIQKFISLLLL